MKIDIKCRFSGSVLFSHECEGNTIKLTLEMAVKDRADLRRASLSDADLSYADLSYADLSYADLSDADLSYANLSYANLSYANLSYADLSYADLSYANLSYANLYGANLRGAKIKDNSTLIGERPIFQVGPIGSRFAYFVAYITDKGLRFDAGCQRQITRDVFEGRLASEHDDNIHAKEYRAALAMIDCHAELWTPKQVNDSEGK